MKGQTEQSLSMIFCRSSALSQAPVATGHELLEFPHKEEIAVFQVTRNLGVLSGTLEAFSRNFLSQRDAFHFSIEVLIYRIAIPLLLSHCLPDGSTVGNFSGSSDHCISLLVISMKSRSYTNLTKFL